METPFSYAGNTAGAISTPDSINPLLPTYYQFTISRLPGVNYFCQTASLPSLSLSQVSMPTRFTTLQSPSKITFDELTVTFVVDEAMKNWMEIYNWMRCYFVYNRCLKCFLLLMPNFLFLYINFYPKIIY